MAKAMSLVARMGDDTLGKIERAASWRYSEAHQLQLRGRALGAIYLYGYCLEMRLKGAYYRLAGLVPATMLQPYRKPAETAIKSLLSLPANTPVGHNLKGWAMLVLDARAKTASLTPFTAAFTADLNMHVGRASLCWSEVLRYRANRPYDVELQAVRDAARWVCRNYRQLWT